MAELLVVSVLAAVTMVAVYEALIVQEQSYRAGGTRIHDQDALRTALGILESELREVGTIGGTAVGGADVSVAEPDSVKVRAQRKIAFICTLSKSEKWLVTWNLGDDFAGGDKLLLFFDGDVYRYQDDRWDTVTVQGIQASTDATCAAAWPDARLQRVQLASGGPDLTDVSPGAPLRSYEWVTYGIYDFGDLGWGLGRHRDGQQPTYLVGGLAPPGRGLEFQYFDAGGLPTATGAEIARMQITMRTAPKGLNTSPVEMSTNLFLRNN